MSADHEELSPGTTAHGISAADPGFLDVVVTGATGFLGARLVRRLVQLGAGRLRCLVRDSGRAAAAGLPAASVRLADLDTAGDPEALRDAVRGAGAIVHLAGALKAWHRRGFDAVNVGGTARLVAAAVECAPTAHFLLVSSLAAAGPSVDGEGTDAPPERCRPISAYGDSKRRGELAVTTSSLPWTIVRPPVVYGPGDGATRLLFRQAMAPLTAVPPRPRPLSAMHADDVVAALVLALQRRRVGAIVPLDGPERTDTHAFVRAFATAAARRARLVPVPLPIARCAALASDAWAWLTGNASYFNRDKVHELAAPGWVADRTAAPRLLGFAPRIGLAEGLAAVAGAEGFAAAARPAT